MAEKRMFAQRIIDSDAFLDMPASAQALYFHLAMRADDDGFIDNPRKIQRICGAGVDDLKLLAAKSFLIPFESGVVVIKHWKIHNYIAKDRYTPTIHSEEKAMLELDENKAYTPCIQDVYRPYTECIQNDDTDKIREDKNRSDKSREEKKSTRFTPPTLEEVTAYCRERGNNIDPQHFIDYYQMNGWKVGGKTPMKDWKAAVRTWEQREKEKPAAQPAPRQAAPARPTYQKKPNFFNDYTHDYSHGAPDWDAIQSQMEAEPTLKFAKS